ncbi:MAG: SDR family oxidoreductase [bacterium]
MASNAGLTGLRLHRRLLRVEARGRRPHARLWPSKLAKHGVTSNAICPGFVETDMARASIDRIMETTGRTETEARAALAGLSPQRRLIQVEEVVHAVRALLPASARGINGQAVAVDGGQVLH